MFAIASCTITNLAASAKDQLIQRIGHEQQQAEKQILQMWMNGQRNKEFELILADYVAREVRYRAMSGQADNGTLLATVNADGKRKLTSSIELGRLLVLEYFKRKGVNLQGKCFVKGSYIIGLRKDNI
jgi:hypothetical protein